MDVSELRTWAAQQAEACKADALRNAEPQAEPQAEQKPEQGDRLPPFGKLDFANMPQLSPQLVTGVLRQGHTLTLTAPSKAGKTWCLLDFGVSLACGLPWLGFPCEGCRVLYVDFELDPASFAHRVAKVAAAKGAAFAKVEENFVPWNLRGHSAPMAELLPEVLRRLERGGFGAVILDPVYLLLDGDENSAGDVRGFVRSVSALCAETGASVAYSHHHSKGAGNYARAIDRGAGSGVFGRFADASLDFMQLDAEGNASFAAEHAKEIEAGCTWWKVECTLRDFPAQTFAVRYEFPLFYRADAAEDLKPETAAQMGARAGGDAAKRKKEESNAALARVLESLWDAHPEGIPADVAAKADGRTPQTVKRAVDALDGWKRRTIGGNECRFFPADYVEPGTEADAAATDAADAAEGAEVREGAEKA